ncbi:MAG: ATP-binding cassette domain-containing protein [Clostridia bacterium]|nr:ATP-binding cassette domain-containing protein [Clostridia bacterium]
MIEVKNLVKNYGPKNALDDVSFTIEKGEVVGLLGPNGAGKSTAMNIITGCLSSTGGEVRIAGIDMFENPDDAKKLIGFLPEQPPLYQDMTVDEYLGFVFDLKKCTENKKEHLDGIKKTAKISEVSNRLIKNLSKGYRQRVGIAQALIGDPPIIIFDEPTVGLDPKQIIEIRNLIRNLGRNHTVILSTHILSEVQSVCDRVIIINEGKIVADERTDRISDAVKTGNRYTVKVCGPQRDTAAALREIQGITRVDSLGERDGDAYTFMIESAPGVDIRKPVFFAMSRLGKAIIGMESAQADLEDVFVRLTETVKGGKK